MHSLQGLLRTGKNVDKRGKEDGMPDDVVDSSGISRNIWGAQSVTQ